MAAPKTKPGSAQRLLHLNTVQEMLKQGYGTSAIARATDRSPATITRDKRKILDEWHREMMDSVIQQKTLALLQTEAVFHEAVMVHTKYKSDPRWLKVALDAISRKCAILGLDAPKGVKAEVQTQSMDHIGIEETMELLHEVVGGINGATDRV